MESMHYEILSKEIHSMLGKCVKAWKRQYIKYGNDFIIPPVCVIQDLSGGPESTYKLLKNTYPFIEIRYDIERSIDKIYEYPPKIRITSDVLDADTKSQCIAMFNEWCTELENHRHQNHDKIVKTLIETIEIMIFARNMDEFILDYPHNSKIMDSIREQYPSFIFRSAIYLPEILSKTSVSIPPEYFTLQWKL